MYFNGARLVFQFSPKVMEMSVCFIWLLYEILKSKISISIKIDSKIKFVQIERMKKSEKGNHIHEYALGNKSIFTDAYMEISGSQ